MGLKAGWLALFAFVWIIGAILGSTFEGQASTAAGMSYSTGTATFTYNSATVTGAGTAWSGATMAGGRIRSDTDLAWYKIASVTNPTTIVLSVVYAETGGAGHNYTIQAVPGWAGTGSGGYSEDPTTTFEKLLDVRNAIYFVPILGGIPTPLPNPDYFKAVFKVLTWRFSFMQNPDGSLAYPLFYYIFMAPIVAMGVLAMISLIVQIIAQIFSTL